jgi:hypothetical protein
MLFIEKLLLDLAAVKKEGKKPTLEVYEALRQGEDVIHVVSDPDLLALISVLESKRDELAHRWQEQLNLDKETLTEGMLYLEGIKELLPCEFIYAFPDLIDASFFARRRGDDLVIVKNDQDPGIDEFSFIAGIKALYPSGVAEA